MLPPLHFSLLLFHIFIALVTLWHFLSLFVYLPGVCVCVCVYGWVAIRQYQRPGDLNIKDFSQFWSLGSPSPKYKQVSLILKPPFLTQVSTFWLCIHGLSQVGACVRKGVRVEGKREVFLPFLIRPLSLIRLGPRWPHRPLITTERLYLQMSH